MKNLFKLTHLILVLIFLTSCKEALFQDERIKNSEDQQSESLNKSKSKLEVRFSCGEDGISEFLNTGWVVVEENTEEKICSWKSIPADKYCDMEKDKGCKVTVPDKIGEEKIYLLEK